MMKTIECSRLYLENVKNIRKNNQLIRALPVNVNSSFLVLFFLFLSFLSA